LGVDVYRDVVSTTSNLGTLTIRATARPRLWTGVSWALGLLSLVLGCGESNEAPSGEPAPAAIRWLGTPVRFADQSEAREVLGASDAFTRTLSAFDRGYRMRTLEPTLEADYLAHAAEQALDWEARERTAWETSARTLSEALEGLELPLPDEVLLVSSSGDEDVGAPYTRGNAIVLPFHPTPGRFSIIAHELFHVASRFDSGLLGRLAPLIGFEPLAEIPMPGQLDERRVTNPDAFALNAAIRVQLAGGDADVVPMLRSAEALEEALESPDFFALLRIELLRVDLARGELITEPHGGITAIAAEDTDYYELASVNTSYVLHAEEVLADNFALLMERRLDPEVEPERPEVLDAIEAELGGGD
jgi:hypothetical protein